MMREYPPRKLCRLYGHPFRSYPIARVADRLELIGTRSMNRERLISALEIGIRERDNIGFQYPTIPRLTDWTIFILESVDFLMLDGVVNFKAEDAKE